MPGSKYLFGGESDAPPRRAALSEAFHCLLACGAVLRKSRDQVRDRLAVPRYGNGLPVLDRPEEFGQAHLGFGSSNFTHIDFQPVVLTIPFYRRPSSQVNDEAPSHPEGRETSCVSADCAAPVRVGKSRLS